MGAVRRVICDRQGAGSISCNGWREGEVDRAVRSDSKSRTSRRAGIRLGEVTTIRAA